MPGTSDQDFILRSKWWRFPTAQLTEGATNQHWLIGELPLTASPNTTGCSCWMFWVSDTETGVAKCFCSHVTRSGGLGWGYPAQLYSLELLVVLLGRGGGCSPHLLARSWLELEHFHFLKSWIFPKIVITHSVLHFISQTANKSS